jgi:protein TonB
MNRTQAILVGGSLVLHVAVGVWMGFLPKEKKTNAVAIALAESQKKKEEAKPPPPPPPPPAAVQPAPRAKIAAPVPKAVEPPPEPVAAKPAPAGDAPSAMDGFADLGLAMGGNGMALPGGPGNGRGGDAKPATSAQPAVRKVKELAPPVDECKEDPVKPQLERQTQPAYTSEGRQASIEGVVKLEVSVDETGRVTNVRVLKGLGFGLDESAVAAARQWTFKPATKCGKAVPYVVKPGVRFQLGS